jgi:hypothetical protein
MCPACMASAAVTVAGVIAAGGLTALATRLLHLRNRAERIFRGEPKEKEK